MTTRPLLGLSLAAVAIGGGVLGYTALNPPVTSFDSALARLERRLLPSIALGSAMAPSSLASAEAPLPLAERLPQAEAFPVHGAPADANNPSGSTLRVEIVSSLEKADNQRAGRRWLVDAAERFNQRRKRGNDGRRIEVVIRPIPSGLAAQMLVAGRYRPAGYSPASQQWLALLRHDGIAPTLLQPSLVGNRSVIAVRGAAWKQSGGGQLAFGPVIERTLAGQLRMGICNPYLCSPGLDFMQTLLWTTAGHAVQGGELQTAELDRTSVQRSLELFQQRVSRIDPTYIEQIEIWKRRPEALDAAVMAEQSYRQLQREPGFEDLVAVPFGADQGSPLVALPWTTGPERQALEQFARFATSAPLQTLARSQNFGDPSPVPAHARPPQADGALLSKVQRLWKQRKDGGRTVYLQLLVDVSGSMNDDDRLSQLKRALILASGAINSGNQVGLISFSDQPTRLMPLQPYDANSRARLLATVRGLQANGATALYDGLAVALHDLMQARRRDPNGRFHLLVLSDGMATKGLNLGDLRSVIENSNISITPIAYGNVNDGELRDIAAIRESAVYRGDPQRILPLINDLVQTAL
ncbi:MAG: VWA domain-containing protein [Synechococcaceae cyanobacterium]